MLVTIPAGRWHGEHFGADWIPPYGELLIEPTGVMAGIRPVWRTVVGWRTDLADRWEARVQVDTDALPPQLRVPAGMACWVIPANGWWLPTEGDLVVQVEQVRPAAADPVTGAVTWAELHGQRVLPDGTCHWVVGLVRAEALPPQLKLGGGAAQRPAPITPRRCYNHSGQC